MQLFQKNIFIAFLTNFQGWEIFIIFFAILLLFGAKRLPELARGLGKSIREFKKAIEKTEDTINNSINTEQKDKKLENKELK